MLTDKPFLDNGPSSNNTPAVTMTEPEKSISARFAAAAETYDRHAGVQRDVADRVMKIIPSDVSPADILDIGCGTGILTGRIVAAFPDAKLCALDIAPGMIEKASQRLSAASRVEWITGSIEQLDPGRQFDLIVSNSSLHWITPVESAFICIRKLLRNNGILCFSIMLKDTFAELHTARMKIAPNKPAARLPGKDAVVDALHRAGFSIISREQGIKRETYAYAEEFLRTIHEQGVTGGPVSRKTTPLTRKELQRFVSFYNANYTCPESKGVYASYHFMCVSAAVHGQGNIEKTHG